MSEQVPIYQKLNLTIKEAAEYSNIGINRIAEMISDENCPFVLFVWRNRLIKREKFEEYINSNSTRFL